MAERFDLAIIGGGINGTALAELAAHNGYRTVLLERTDFGAGVTSRSTRLIHGGLRYLEHGHVGLVRESLREREALLHAFPGQVQPLPFLIPVYRRDSRAPWWIGLGLEAYQLMGRSRWMPRHRHFSSRKTLQLEPGLDPKELRAGFLYYDCQAVYPERLALEMALAAEALGAEVRNHAPVAALLGNNGEITGVRLESGEEIQARLVVNAAGPWADQVRRLAPGPAGTRPPLLSLLSGAHVVTSAFPGAPAHAIYHEARADRRPFFVVPWRGLWLIGTTETPHAGDPDAVAPTPSEVEYLLRETNLLFPEAHLTPEAVLYAYAGPRPLLRAASEAQAMSREHGIYDHEKEEGLRGMVTLLGGKLTTARAFAEAALRHVASKLGRGKPRRPVVPQASTNGLPARLTAIYGKRAVEIVRLERAQPELERPLCVSGLTTAAEVVHAIRREKARTLGDVLLRRTGVAFAPCQGRDCAAAAAHLAAPLLGWDDPAREQAVRDYYQELDRTLPSGLRP
jgi:glycerol-3-phosphate dehydrogenase